MLTHEMIFIEHAHAVHLFDRKTGTSSRPWTTGASTRVWPNQRLYSTAATWSTETCFARSASRCTASGSRSRSAPSTKSLEANDLQSTHPIIEPFYWVGEYRRGFVLIQLSLSLALISSLIVNFLLSRRVA